MDQMKHDWQREDGESLHKHLMEEENQNCTASAKENQSGNLDGASASNRASNMDAQGQGKGWRVGTLSMGLTMICLGLYFLFSIWFQLDVELLMRVWWPLVLIILGFEIFFYLFKVGKDARVKYDLFSIFMIAIIGFTSIGMSFLSTSGITQLITREVSRDAVSANILPWRYGMPLDVKYLVVETNGAPLKIEGGADQDLHLFGTYDAWIGLNEQLPEVAAADLVQTYQVDETLYVQVRPEYGNGYRGRYFATDLTLIIPQSMKAEIRSDNSLQLTPGQLEQDWRVEVASNLTLRLVQSANQQLDLLASTALQDVEHLLEWQKVVWDGATEGVEGYTALRDLFYRAEYQSGTGGPHLQAEVGGTLDVIWLQ